MNTREIGVSKQKWIPKNERIWVIVASVIAVLIVIWQLKGLMQLPSAILAVNILNLLLEILVPMQESFYFL